MAAISHAAAVVAPFGGVRAAGSDLQLGSSRSAVRDRSRHERPDRAASGSPLTLQAAANTCYVGTTAGLCALDAASGQLRWTSKVSLLRATDELLVCAAQENVQGFDPISGAARWSFRLDRDEGTYDGTLAAAGLVHLRSKSRIFTLDAVTGALRWEQSRPAEYFNWAASRAGLFYATSLSAVRLDAATGSSLWSRPLPAPTFDVQTPSITCNDDSLFLSGPDGQEAWDARSGVQQWHVDQPGSDPTSRTTADWMISLSGRQISTSDTVILIERGYRAAHRVSARSTRDGDTLWTARLDGVDSGVIDLALGTDNLYVLPLNGSDASVVRAISLT
jgi:outer membrane protein assembly factor BamB